MRGKVPAKSLGAHEYTIFSVSLDTVQDEGNNPLSSRKRNDAACFLTSAQCHSAGVVPEPKGEMEEEGAFWSDAAGPNTLLNSL